MDQRLETFSQLLDRLLAHWRQLGLPRRNGASPGSVTAFEAHYGVSLPLRMQEYFLKTDGMAGDGWRIYDVDYTINFWPLEEVKLVADIKDCVRDARPYAYCYAFADYLLWSHGYAIRLSEAGFGEVVLVGGLIPRKVADTFEDFVVKYLDSPQDLF